MHFLYVLTFSGLHLEFSSHVLEYARSHVFMQKRGWNKCNEVCYSILTYPFSLQFKIKDITVHACCDQLQLSNFHVFVDLC